MSLRTIIFLVIAVAVTATTAFFAPRFLASKQAPQRIARPAPAPDTQILVAAKDVSTGQFLRINDLKWQAWPKASLAEGQTVKGKRPLEDFVGAVVRIPIAKGEPLTDKKIVQPGDRGFLAAVLDPGYRAISVPVDATKGIAGFVSPGDRVDVILTVKFRNKSGEDNGKTRYLSETLLVQIRVLAIDQKVDIKDSKIKPSKTVTLEVTPKMVETVALALKMGSISLSLRSLAVVTDLGPTGPGTAANRARLLKAPPERNSRAFTLDTEIVPTIGGRNKKKKTVNVVRGRKSTVQKY